MIPAYAIIDFWGICLFAIGFDSEDEFLMIVGSFLTFTGLLLMFVK